MYRVLKDKKGVAIEWAIAFGFVVFALTLVLTTIIAICSAPIRAQRKQQAQQDMISQIGEYFLRSCEFGGEFPTGTDPIEKISFNSITEKYTPSNYFDNYSWMDDIAKTFFAKCASKGYIFNTTICEDNGNFWNFYAAQGMIRTLTVNDSSGNVLLSLAVAEDYYYDTGEGILFTKSTNPETTFTVLNWTTGGSVYNYPSDNLNILQRIWKWVGKIFDRTEEPTSATHSVVYKFQTKDKNGNDLLENATCSTAAQGFNGDELVMPRPDCKGYKFLGWSTQEISGGQLRAAGSVLSSKDFEGIDGGYGLKFYAQWEPYSIVLKDGNTVVGSYGAKCVLPELSKEGYFFLGWQNGSQDPTASGTTVYARSEDVTYKAKWVSYSDCVSVSYHLNNGTCSGAVNTVLKPDTKSYTLPSSATKTGYTFAGWSYDSSKVTVSGNVCTFKISKGTVDFTANYTINTYKIKYLVDGSASASYPETSYNIESVFTLPAKPAASGGKTYSNWAWSSTDGAANNWSGIDISAQIKNRYGNITLKSTSTKYKVTVVSTPGSSETKEGSFNLGTPTRAGYKFTGWTVTSGSASIGGGSSYNIIPTSDCTVTAGWQGYSVTIKYNNGVTNQTGSGVVTISSNPPTWKGHTFGTWTVTNGTRSGSTVTPNADNCVVSASWTTNSYTISIDKNGGSDGTSSASYTFSTSQQTVSLTLPSKSKNNFDGWEISTNSSPEISISKDYKTITIPANAMGNIVLKAKWKSNSGCVLPGTMITMADGTQKPVEQIVPGDMLLTWDLVTGSYSAKPVVFNDHANQQERIYNIYTAVFSDDTKVEIAKEHGFFDVNLGKYVYINGNSDEYIGHSFVKYSENGSIETVKLVDVKAEQKCTKIYNPITATDFCYYVNGMLSIPAGIDGLYNIFDVDVTTMKYDEVKMQNNLEIYGYYSVEDYGGKVSNEMFNAFNGKYLKVAVEKGILTWDMIYYHINHLNSIFASGN